MANISYTESGNLQKNINNINFSRQNILLAVIPPRNESKLHWDFTVERIFWSLSLSETPLTKSEVSRVLRSGQIKSPTPSHKLVIDTKNTLDYITQNYLSTKKLITLRDVNKIIEIGFGGKIKIDKRALDKSLSYFHTSKEHPVIQAGLIHFLIFSHSGNPMVNRRLASLLSYLYLYKEGFDFRSFLVIDEYFRKNFTDYNLRLTEASQTNAQTLWLEFFTSAIANTLVKAQNAIKESNKEPMESTSTFTTLNNRQKQILTILERPGSTITNRDVQREFKISQITASRDLTSLATRLLILSHGKGRSVYYAKV